MKNIFRIGGACAGKTTSLKLIDSYLREKGYKVIINRIVMEETNEK